jgi:hypothetical protein
VLDVDSDSQVVWFGVATRKDQKFYRESQSQGEGTTEAAMNFSV